MKDVVETVILQYTGGSLWGEDYAPDRNRSKGMIVSW